MPKNTAIDDYIATKEAFAQSMLIYLRDVVHSASPDIIETIKWRQPCFEHNGLVCAIAAFKKHVTLSFFKGKRLKDSEGVFSPSDNNELTSLKFFSLADIPSADILHQYVQQAMVLNTGSSVDKKTIQRKDKSILVMPDDFAAALAKTPPTQSILMTLVIRNKKITSSG